MSRVASFASLGLASLVFASPLVGQCPDGSPPPCAARGARPPAATAPSVAVLYFDNRSRDTADAYLADGLTEQTIAQLGEVPRLTVSSRYAVRRFRGAGASQDPAAIGRALNVTYLVNGSIERAGNRLRVGVELLRAGTGVRVWGDHFDRTETDLLRLQDDIASAIATGVVGRLLPAERAALASRRTQSDAAFAQFMRGNFYLAQRTPATLLLAIRAYRAAAAADPSYTDALAREAYAYGNALDDEYDIGIARDSLVQLAMRTAQHAVALDSLASDAWMALAYARQGAYPRTFEGVRDAYDRALRLNPRNAEAHHQFASYLGYMGDTVAARQEGERALAVEPGRAISWFQLAELALVRREPREALRMADSATTADPAFGLTGVTPFMAGIELGDTAMAQRGAASLVRVMGAEGVGAYLVAFLAAWTDRPGARDAFRAIGGATRRSPTAPGSAVANLYGGMLNAVLGNTSEALQFVEAAGPRGIRVHDFLRRPEFDALRGEPRFQAVWRETLPPGMSW